MNWLGFVILTAYILLGYHFWRTRWQQQRVISAQQVRREHLILGLLLLAHASAIFPGLSGTENVYIGTAKIFSLIAWLALMSYWLSSFSLHLEGLQPIEFLIAVLLLALSPLVPAGHIPLAFTTPLFKTHLILATLAYGLMLHALCLALLTWIIDRQLHSGREKSVLNRLPPLLTLEKYLFANITAGFVILTLALISGFIFAKAMFGDYSSLLSISDKPVFALLTWTTFAILLCGRKLRGWRGRFVINWVIAGFIFLVLAYISSNIALYLMF